jgi:hypothetical protein
MPIWAIERMFEDKVQRGELQPQDRGAFKATFPLSQQPLIPPGRNGNRHEVSRGRQPIASTSDARMSGDARNHPMSQQTAYRNVLPAFEQAAARAARPKKAARKVTPRGPLATARLPSRRMPVEPGTYDIRDILHDPFASRESSVQPTRTVETVVQPEFPVLFAHKVEAESGGDTSAGERKKAARRGYDNRSGKAGQALKAESKGKSKVEVEGGERAK